jgi:hypothetical protein
VIGVTRRTPRLLHLIVNHRDHGVVGDAALARTVVVYDVTEPNSALLHESVRPPQTGPAARIESTARLVAGPRVPTAGKIALCGLVYLVTASTLSWDGSAGPQARASFEDTLH